MGYGAAHRVELREELDKVRAREAVLVQAIEDAIYRMRNINDSVTREEAANMLEESLFAAPAVPPSTPDFPVEVIIRPVGLGGIFKPHYTIKHPPNTGIRHLVPEFNCDVEIRR